MPLPPQAGQGNLQDPRLNAKNFEKLIVNEIRENVLTESNIRDLVKLLDEEMDGVARDQRERLQNIEEELEDVKKRLGRIWNHIETTDTEMADASDRIREGFAPKVQFVPKVGVLFRKSTLVRNHLIGRQCDLFG